MKTNLSLLKKVFLFRYFIIGILMGLLVHSSGSCRKDDPAPEDPIAEKVDVGKIDDGAKTVEAAFLNGEVLEIKKIMTDAALEFYGPDLSSVNKTNLKKLGDALKTRKIKVYTDLYAEYEYTKDGITFTIAMAKQEDGSWKLMRF